MPVNQKFTSSMGMPLGLRSMTSFRLSPETYSITTQPFALIIVLDVKQGDQVGVFQIQALADTAQLDVQVALDAFQGDFFAGIAGGEVDLAEPADADASLDRVAVQRARSRCVYELHRTGSRLKGRLPGGSLPRGDHRLLLG